MSTEDAPVEQSISTTAVRYYLAEIEAGRTENVNLSDLEAVLREVIDLRAKVLRCPFVCFTCNPDTFT